jgi:hypothetical protein
MTKNIAIPIIRMPIFPNIPKLGKPIDVLPNESQESHSQLIGQSYFRTPVVNMLSKQARPPGIRNSI